MSEKLVKIIDSFKSDPRRLELYKITQSVEESVKNLKLVSKEIESFAGNYDLDESSPGNGYRSFVYIVEKATEKTLAVCGKIHDNHTKFFFREKFYERCFLNFN